MRRRLLFNATSYSSRRSLTIFFLWWYNNIWVHLQDWLQRFHRSGLDDEHIDTTSKSIVLILLRRKASHSHDANSWECILLFELSGFLGCCNSVLNGHRYVCDKLILYAVSLVRGINAISPMKIILIVSSIGFTELACLF